MGDFGGLTQKLDDLQDLGIADLLPQSAHGARVLLDAFLMERCLVDVAHEIRDRPDWLPIALKSTLGNIAAAVPKHGSLNS